MRRVPGFALSMCARLWKLCMLLLHSKSASHARVTTKWYHGCCTGARVPLQAAPAPGPAAAGSKAVDLHFVVSADKATFNGDKTLSFANVSQTAQFVANSGRSGRPSLQVCCPLNTYLPEVESCPCWALN